MKASCNWILFTPKIFFLPAKKYQSSSMSFSEEFFILTFHITADSVIYVEDQVKLISATSHYVLFSHDHQISFVVCVIWAMFKNDSNIMYRKNNMWHNWIDLYDERCFNCLCRPHNIRICVFTEIVLYCVWRFHKTQTHTHYQKIWSTLMIISTKTQNDDQFHKKMLNEVFALSNSLSSIFHLYFLEW